MLDYLHLQASLKSKFVSVIVVQPYISKWALPLLNFDWYMCDRAQKFTIQSFGTDSTRGLGLVQAAAISSHLCYILKSLQCNVKLI